MALFYSLISPCFAYFIFILYLQYQLLCCSTSLEISEKVNKKELSSVLCHHIILPCLRAELNSIIIIFDFIDKVKRIYKIYSHVDLKHKGQNLEISEKLNKKVTSPNRTICSIIPTLGTRYFLIIIFDFTLNVKDIYKIYSHVDLKHKGVRLIDSQNT